MDARGARDLPGLTAREIWDSHFGNKLDEEEQTRAIAWTAGFLNERGFDVWVYREPLADGTIWSDGLGKLWAVEPASEEIRQWEA